jgi:hypothetical protein
MFTTAEPAFYAAGTTSVLAPAVVALDLPEWQCAVWARRPLFVSLFDALSAHDVDHSFLVVLVRNGVWLVPAPAALTRYCLPTRGSCRRNKRLLSSWLCLAG